MPTRKAANPRPLQPKHKGPESGRKKTLRINQELLDRARQALGARTETDTVAQALEGVVRREQQVLGLRLLAALGPIDPTRID